VQRIWRVVRSGEERKFERACKERSVCTSGNEIVITNQREKQDSEKNSVKNKTEMVLVLVAKNQWFLVVFIIHW
jgi:hypothetical protein